MKKFEFSSKSNTNHTSLIFSGDVFFSIYKNADFLRSNENIETILAKGYELRKTLKEVEPGQHVKVSGMLLEKNSPLIVKRTGPNVAVEAFEFTTNRLSGLVAAYAFENRFKFPDLASTEALDLGLEWDKKDEKRCRLFLSAVSGTEHFYNQFQFWPLICGLRKLQLKTITLEPVIKMAKIKNQDGVRMATTLLSNLDTVKDLWTYFPGSSVADFKLQMEILPPQLKKIFYNKN